MREVVYKNLTSPTNRKKDIVLKEVFEKDGVVARTERRCFYYIKEIRHLENDAELQKWMDAQGACMSTAKRNFHIFKEHKDGLGEDKLMCKIAGTFYAVSDRTVYTIAFLHSFKITFVKATIA